MAIHVGINGFGRIGRLVFRAPHDPASSGRPCRGVEDRGNDAGFGSADKVMHLSTAGSHANIPITAPAMKSGVVEFLTKPFGDQALLKQDRVARRQADELSALRARCATLSRREREVMGLVVSAMPNKQIAGRLGTSEVTVKFTVAA
jgi:DNA-binding CsgD family transcriptional regulator